MKIFTNDGLRRIGDHTVDKENITMLDLIERAASAVSYELISRWRTSKRFVFFAGPGDNGADALAVARMMYEQGYKPEVYLFNIKSAQLSPCCLANRDRLIQTAGDDIDFIEVIQNFTPPELDENDVVVDGLFGSGLRTPSRAAIPHWCSTSTRAGHLWCRSMCRQECLASGMSAMTAATSSVPT